MRSLCPGWASPRRVNGAVWASRMSWKATWRRSRADFTSILPFEPQKGLPREGFRGWRWLQQEDLRGVGGRNRLGRPPGVPTVTWSSCGASPPALAPPGPCSARVTRSDRGWLRLVHSEATQTVSPRKFSLKKIVFFYFILFLNFQMLNAQIRVFYRSDKPSSVARTSAVRPCTSARAPARGGRPLNESWGLEHDAGAALHAGHVRVPHLDHHSSISILLLDKE